MRRVRSKRMTATFRNRWFAASAASTVALLVYLETSDSSTPTQEHDDLRDQSTVWVFAGAMATAIVTSTASLRRHRPVPRHRSRWWSGLGLIWTGAAVNRLAKRQLGKNYRSRLTVVDGHEVVTTGPYRHVRHPMYSGASLICLGAALAVDSPASFAWALPPMALIHRITVEESMLRNSLGDAYDEYAKNRARLLPGLW